MIKGAIFDFDGTLFDSMSVWYDIGESYLRSKGYIPEAGLSEKLKIMSLHQSSRYIKEEYRLCESAEEISDGINGMIENAYIDSILPKDGSMEFLEELKNKGIQICIATATDRYLIEAALHRCGMIDYFDDILTCSDLATSKDKPLIFREAMKMLDTEKNDTIVFEDAYHAVQTAKKEGFFVIGIYDAYEDREEDVKKASDIYLKNYWDTEKFWKFVSEKQSETFSGKSGAPPFVAI